MMSDLETRTNQQLQQAENRREQDNVKIQELSTLVQGLSQMVQKMSESQAAFQDQILKMQQSSGQSGGASQPQSTREVESAPSVPEPPKSVEDMEVEKITQYLMAGQYDQATISVSLTFAN